MINASNACPPVSAPSPITAIFCLFSCYIFDAIDIPREAPIDVDECPTPNAS